MTETARRPVLVATDLSDAADEALRQAHAEAQARQAPLAVAHVLPESFLVRVLFPQEAGVDPHHVALERKANDVVRAYVREILGATAEFGVEVASGSPYGGILAIAARVDADLVVLAPGHTALRVARAAGCPVLVARPSPPAGPVIGASDFSDAALPALHAAADHARSRRQPLHAVHCLDLDPIVATAGAAGTLSLPVLSSAVFEECRVDSDARLAAAVASLAVPGDRAVRRGTPAPTIVGEALAVGASLVVVGTRGRTGLPRILMGSTADYVVSHAPCSVLVVPLYHEAPPPGAPNAPEDRPPPPST